MLLQRRLQRELTNIYNSPTSNIKLIEDGISEDMLKWEVKINGADKTLYENQTFILRFIFDDKYPFEPPQVYFIGKNIPVHPHIYANGHICLSILSTEWTPALTVESICISIISMLSSCRKKVRPPDNDAYIQYAPSNPKLTNWFIHDNTV